MPPTFDLSTSCISLVSPSTISSDRGSANGRGGGTKVRWVLESHSQFIKGTNPALKKPSNIPEIYAKMFGRFH